MGSVNKVTLVGNLGADPELRQTQAGQPVANLRIATSDSWLNKQTGNREERTEWHSVSVWGKQAEIAGRYLSKGRSVYIEGRLQSREYQAQDGQTRKVWEVVASQVVFLGGRETDAPRQEQRDDGWQSQPQPQQQQQQRQPERHQAQPQRPPQNLGWGADNENIPF